ncbi:chemoreceptor glutamine deamidase CheD [Shewanella corallii]|uniref:Probable chemoreceptor glutamine deamidase CheD n=1 Tax=Shewanella corallii TaxID=560080 RepID=A0ABT0N8V6_9GAMM|nr:chemoreceptor glutamine deamidase CheD [Shewanella corallii]MCL2914570.1 chemoreceptor glutamine deamidase CheD [Shewanella corallii]
MTANLTNMVYPGFETIPRYWNREHECMTARVDPGEYYISCQDEYIFTRLGSCITACIWDPVMRVGGLNHFLLPERKAHDDWHQLTSYSCRYGNWAMEQLINSILSAGGQRRNLQAKVFGGAKLGGMSIINVGESNIEFVRQYLATEGIEIIAEDVGGIWPRKVMFHPMTGKAKVKRLSSEPVELTILEEKEYLDGVKVTGGDNDIELFGD